MPHRVHLTTRFHHPLLGPADDTQMLVCDLAVQLTQHTVDSAKAWMSINKLKMNDDKTELLLLQINRYVHHLSCLQKAKSKQCYTFLCELPWLLVRAHTNDKMDTLCYCGLHGLTPSYPSELLKPHHPSWSPVSACVAGPSLCHTSD